MSKKPKVIRRGKIIYIVNSDSVVAGVGGNQWISYNQYNNHNRQGITAFRTAILKSKEDEYATQLTKCHSPYSAELKVRALKCRKDLNENSIFRKL